MKNLILTFLVVLVCGTLGYAQEVKLGLGLSVTDFSKVSDGESKGKVGAQFGGSIVFGEKFYIEPGIYYVSKSTELSFTEDGVTDVTNDVTDMAMKSVRLPSTGNSIVTGDYDVDAKISGIRIPVAVGLGVLGSNESLINVRAFGGFSGFFVTNTSDDVDKDSIEKTNWGVFAGAGADVWIFFLDLSYEWSLTDISKDIDTVDIGKQRSFFGNVGVRLNF